MNTKKYGFDIEKNIFLSKQAGEWLDHLEQYIEEGDFEDLPYKQTKDEKLAARTNPYQSVLHFIDIMNEKDLPDESSVQLGMLKAFVAEARDYHEKTGKWQIYGKLDEMAGFLKNDEFVYGGK